MSTVKADTKSPGQLLYEDSLARMPEYPNGTPRKSWDELSSGQQSVWDMNAAAGQV